MIRARSFTSSGGASTPLAIEIALPNGQSGVEGGGIEQMVINPNPLSNDNFMLTSGGAYPVLAGIAYPRSQSSPYDWEANTTGLEPAYEIQMPDPLLQSETGWTRMMYELRTQRAAAGEQQPLLGATAVGSGGMSIGELSTSPPGAGPQDGGPSNSRISLISCVKTWLAQCVALNRMPTFWMPWHQGESQYTESAASYMAEIIAYRNLMDADLLPLIRKVNPDHGPIQMVIAQLGVRGEDGHPTSIGEGQLMAALADPNIWCFACHNIPKFDNYHHTAIGRQFLPAQWAKARRELVATGSLRMLRMVSCTTTDWVNFDVSVTDHPTDDTILQVTDGPLLLDDPYVASITGAGFMTSDGIGRVATATVTGPTTIRLTFSVPPPLGADLMYALSVLDFNQVPNSTGNVTDSRAGLATYDDDWHLRRPMLSRRVPIVLTGVGEDPSVLTGIYAWYRADTGLTDGGGGRATDWAPKQGASSINFPTPAKQPLIVPATVNNQQGLYFSLTRTDFGNWTGSLPTGAFSIVAILREEVNSGSANNHIFSGLPTGAGRRHMYFNEASFAGVMEDTVGTTQRGAIKPADYVKGQTVSIIVQSFDNAGARRILTNLQGDAFLVAADVLTGTWTPNNNVAIGGQSGANGSLDATVCDLYILSRTLYATASDAIAMQTLINYGVRRYKASVIPVTSTSVGVKGMTVNDTAYIYKAIATDTWTRAALEAF